jgi:cytochrome b561
MSFSKANSSPDSTSDGYTGLQICLHWVIALIVLMQLVFGESMTATVDAIAEGGTASAFDQQMASLHYWAGISVLVLVFLRLAMRLWFGAPKAPDSLPPVIAFASRAAH